MKINGKRFADSCIDYGHPVNFAILFWRGVLAQIEIGSLRRRRSLFRPGYAEGVR